MAIEEEKEKIEPLFEILEEDEEEERAKSKNSKCANWVGTWNNPDMTDEQFRELLEDWYKDNILQFAVFQREKGEEKGTIHFQFFINFKNARYFKWVKKMLPYGCHFKPMQSTKTHCRNYCSKPDTRVSGPYEIGEFIEERGRSDLAKALRMLKEGVSLEEVEEIYQTQTFMYRNTFKQIELERLNKKLSERLRDVEVTFIYGESGAGKNTMLRQMFGLKNVFYVHTYDNSAFTNYDYQQIIVFDEFNCGFKIPKMNMLLNIEPCELRGLNCLKYANYNKVYIVSNYRLDELYSDVRMTEPKIFQTFNRRIHKIIRLDKNGVQHIERDSEWEDCTNEVDKSLGLTKQLKKTWDIDKYGNKITIFDRYKGVPELQLLKNVETPFKDEAIQEYLSI